jgi:hypothetical protein
VKVGDAWTSAFTPTPENPTNMTVDFAVTGRQTYAGRSTLVVTMVGKSEAYGTTIDYSATAYYDAVAGLVVGVHAERKLTAMRNAGETRTTDIMLR